MVVIHVSHRPSDRLLTVFETGVDVGGFPFGVLAEMGVFRAQLKASIQSVEKYASRVERLHDVLAKPVERKKQEISEVSLSLRDCG